MSKLSVGVTETAISLSWSSPFGRLWILADDNVHAVVWENHLAEDEKSFLQARQVDSAATPLIRQAETQLHEYFQGRRQNFALPLCIQGTYFQKQAWKALQFIPYGSTITYGEQARIVGHRRFARAVGQANGRNRFCLVLPCHRVVPSNRSVGGYAGGSEVKAALIEFERRQKGLGVQSISLNRQNATRPYIR